jgi:hypothetical protein
MTLGLWGDIRVKPLYGINRLSSEYRVRFFDESRSARWIFIVSGDTIPLQ